MALGILMYFLKKRDDDLEDKFLESEKEEKK
jgi:hypothetical protein